jgi:hypothetical protein
LSKKNLMGSHSTGVPTKQESKLGILEYTYTPAMPSTQRERETLQLLGCESGGFLCDVFQKKNEESSDMQAPHCCGFDLRAE